VAVVMMILWCFCDAAIQMGRPSKTRNGNDTSMNGNDGVMGGAALSLPVNLSFHLAGAQHGPGSTRDGSGSGLGSGTGSDVAAQLPDSTMDRCSSLAASRKRSVNVLRQLQSQSSYVGAAKQSLMWTDVGAENAMCGWVATGVGGGEVPADLRVKRPRYSGVLQSPVRGDLTLASRRWSVDDVEVCCIVLLGVLVQSLIVG